MIDFPNSPTLNQPFSAAGKSWTWDGAAWVATAATLAAVATSGDYNDLVNKPTFSSAVTSVAGKTGAVTLAIADVASLQTSLAAKADLVSGLVPASQLPSYVDDVLEYGALGNFPATGESGKIYVATGTGKIYRWSGSAYVEIIASPGSTDAVPEGSTNLYFTNARASAAAPVQSVAGKTGAVTLAIADVASLQATLDGKQAAGSYATAAQGAKADTASQPGHTHTVSEVSGAIAKNSADVSPVSTIRCMTQTEYNALGTYDAQTLYFIK